MARRKSCGTSAATCCGRASGEVAVGADHSDSNEQGLGANGRNLPLTDNALVPLAVLLLTWTSVARPALWPLLVAAGLWPTS